MTTVILTCAAYILISLCLTVGVAKTLCKNGRLFPIDAFHSDEARTDKVSSMNHNFAIKMASKLLG